MARYYFIWNGYPSYNRGILLPDAPEIIRPEERIEHVTIPGRSGELTLTEGDDIYNSYIQTIPMNIHERSALKTAEEWLRGDGDVTFSSEPTLKQKARIINAVTFRKHSKNLDWWSGDVQFYCDPIKHPVSDSVIEVTSSGATVNNPGMIKALPLIEITGSGLITVTIGGKTISLPNCVSGWVLDCENKWVLQSGIPVAGAYSGEFPEIPTGNAIVAFTGSVTKLKITPRWRYL